MQNKTAPTVKHDGSRRWIYPERRWGKWAQIRKRIAYGLILFYLLAPFIQINGLPLLRCDVTTGIVSFFGLAFRFHEASYLLFVFVLFALLLFTVTAIRGRVWCGYACPQTVWIDWVIRPIEEWLEGPATRRQVADQKPLSWQLKVKKCIKHVLFLGVASFLAHVLLAYFIPLEVLLQWVSSSPLEHWSTFVLISFVTFALYFDFAWFREQFCSFLCPYARFQAVMMDDTTPVVSYDVKRGETRGRKGTGDCIDCGLCNRVCPTGIDIREGLQLECIQCSRCVDACNLIMSNLNRKPGLIREVSASELETQSVMSYWQRLKRPRVVIFSCLFLGFLGVFIQMTSDRQMVEVQLTRQAGTTYSVLPTGEYANLFRLTASNTTPQQQQVTILSLDPEVSVICSGCNAMIPAFGKQTFSLMLLTTQPQKTQVQIEMRPDHFRMTIPLILPQKD